MVEKEPMVSEMVHLIVRDQCIAAVITSVDDNGTLLHPFAPLGHQGLLDDWHPYVSLKSARPTSGWHWMFEHE